MTSYRIACLAAVSGMSSALSMVVAASGDDGTGATEPRDHVRDPGAKHAAAQPAAATMGRDARTGVWAQECPQ